MTGKGNYSKEDAIEGKQYPQDGQASETTFTASPLSSVVQGCQEKMAAAIREWYESEGEPLLDLGSDGETWDYIINLVDNLFDPVLACRHQPSALCDSSSLGAANFASLATVIQEKLTVLCGNEGVLVRSAATSRMVQPPEITSTLLSNDTLSELLSMRLRSLAKVKRRNGELSVKEQETVLHRTARLKEAPCPHRLSLFERFGGGTRVEKTSNISVAAGTTNASDMHCKLVNHVFKVAFRKWGPRLNHDHLQLASLVESHALTNYVLSYMSGGKNHISNDADSTSIFYCDYYDFLAYQALPERFKRSSIVPGSYNMEGLPFRPFAVPSHYRRYHESDQRRIFKYERSVRLASIPSMCFDYGEFMCYCIFGLEWDKHLGDIVDSLECCPMNTFEPNVYSGVFKDTHNFNRLGHVRLGVADFALRSVAEFVRAEAYNAAMMDGETEAKWNDSDGDTLSNLRKVIRGSVQRVKDFLENDLADIVAKFKSGIQGCDYGDDGEFECLTAHLFLTRLLDESHVLRNTDIQRTVHSTHISLLRQNTKRVPASTRVQTFSSVKDIPSGVLAGLSGCVSSGNRASYFFGDNAVVSWDGSVGKVIGVWCNAGTDYLADHENVLEKYKDDMLLVKMVKGVLQEASEKGALNPMFFNREEIYRALAARGILSPGVNLTEDGKSFHGLDNSFADFELEVPLEGHSAEMNIGELRGFFSGFRDVIETKALTTYTTTAFNEIGKSIKADAVALKPMTTAETAFVNNLVKSQTGDSTLGMDFSANGSRCVMMKKSGRSLLEVARDLKSNKVAFSSVMKDMGLEVSKKLDAEFAAEMRETYPDTALKEVDESVEDFESSIPSSQAEKLKTIGKETGEELGELEKKISDTELSKATDSVLGKKIGNGITVFMGRFATTSVLVGTVVLGGFLGPAAVAMMHASRGAHLNVVDHTNTIGVTSYKLTAFSCVDKKLGWAKRARHPFREEIDTVIQSNSDFTREEGAFVVTDGNIKSKYRAWAPICGTRDAQVSDCGSWATFDEPHSVLPWVASIQQLPKGQSISCDKGMTPLQAVASTLLSLGKDIAKEVFEVVEDAVVGVTEKAFSAIVNSPAFIVGVPIAAGVAATRLRASNWKMGLITAFAVLVLVLTVRFFSGSGAFTLNWFNATGRVKRKVSEAYEMGKGKNAKMVLTSRDCGDMGTVNTHNFTTKALKSNREGRGSEELRPYFFPAITNHSRTAKTIGADVTSFIDCYKDIQTKMENLAVMAVPHLLPLTTESNILFDPGSLGEDSFTPTALTPRTSTSARLPGSDITLVATALPGNCDISPELVSKVKEPGNVYVIGGDVKMPWSTRSLALPSELRKAVFFSFNSTRVAEQNMDIMNTSDECLYVFPMRDELEFNPTLLPRKVKVQPNSSVSVQVHQTKNARRLFLSCKWGEKQCTALPANVYDHLIVEPAVSFSSSQLGNKVDRILSNVAARAHTNGMDAADVNLLAHSLSLIAKTIGYLRSRGFPVKYLTSTKCLTDLIGSMEDFDMNRYVSQNGGSGVGENVETMSPAPPLSPSPSSSSGNSISLKTRMDNISFLRKAMVRDKNCIFDVAISCGLYYCTPTLVF